MMTRKKLLPMACCISLLSGCASNQTSNQATNAADTAPLTISPTVSVDGSSSSPASLYQLGRYYQGQNRYEQAITAYKKALVADDGFAEAHNGLGVIYSKQGRYSEAIEEFTAALEKAPQASHIYSNLGYTYYLQGQYDESITALKQATVLDPANKRALNNLGLAYAKAGKSEESAQAYANSEQAAELASRPVATEGAVAARQQDAWEQTTAGKMKPSREASGVIIPAEDSHMVIVQMAPAVYELRTQEPSRLEQGTVTNLDIAITKKIHVEVANGNGVTGMAKKVGLFLRHEGYPAARLVNQKPFKVQVSQIQYRDGYQEAAKQLQSNLPGQLSLVQRNDLRADISLRLVLGKDLVAHQASFNTK